MPVWVAMTISSNACSPPAIAAFTSPLSNDAKGSLSFHSGCCGASSFTRSSAKKSWIGIGFSHQSVPSLSKVAIRSLGRTKSAEPSLVTLATKSVIDFLVAPSFHDGSGSAVARATVVARASAQTSAAAMRFCLRLVFMVVSLAVLINQFGVIYLFCLVLVFAGQVNNHFVDLAGEGEMILRLVVVRD